MTLRESINQGKTFNLYGVVVDKSKANKDLVIKDLEKCRHYKDLGGRVPKVPKPPKGAGVP